MTVGESDGGPSEGKPGETKPTTEAPCLQVYEGDYPMSSLSASNQCKGISGPGKCRVKQTNCSVAIDCERVSETFSLNKEGASEAKPVPMGDGVTADCHVEFTNSPSYKSLTLYCSAMGVTCEWGQL